MISEEIENANLSKIEEYQYKRMIGLNENALCLSAIICFEVYCMKSFL